MHNRRLFVKTLSDWAPSPSGVLVALRRKKSATGFLRDGHRRVILKLSNFVWSPIHEATTASIGMIQ